MTLSSGDYFSSDLLSLSLHDALPISLPYEWYDTPNIRVGTFTDFEVLARKDGLRVLDAFGIQGGRVVRRFPNLRASVGVLDRKSTRLNSSHITSSYAVLCLKNKTINI